MVAPWGRVKFGVLRINLAPFLCSLAATIDLMNALLSIPVPWPRRRIALWPSLGRMRPPERWDALQGLMRLFLTRLDTLLKLADRQGVASQFERIHGDPEVGFI